MNFNSRQSYSNRMSQPQNRYNFPTNFTPQTYHPISSGSWESIGGGLTRRSSHISGQTFTSSAKIDTAPNFVQPQFQCPNCTRKVYDGNLQKIVRCQQCGQFYRRDEQNQILEAQIPQSNRFGRVFEEITGIPGGNYIPEMVSLTLGIFKEGLLPQFMLGGRANFIQIFNYYLSPYFKNKLRCLGIGDYFKYGDAKFKVIGAFPSFGLIRENTIIQCSELISCYPISRVQILPIKPSVINQQVFCNTVIPYFKQMPRHIHTGSYLYIGSSQFIVVAAQPSDGIVNSDTNFYFEGEAFDIIQRVTLIPFMQDLSVHYQMLSTRELTQEIVSSFIMPNIQGQKKVVQKGHTIVMNGVTFRVAHSIPERGVITDTSVIQYDGSLTRRDLDQFSHLIIGRNQEIAILAQQLMQFQEIMSQMEGGQMNGADESLVQSLPVHQIETLPSDPEASKCMVCMSQYEQGDLVRTLPCFHIYHTACIDEWLSRSPLCPICKNSIDMSCQRQMEISEPSDDQIVDVQDLEDRLDILFSVVEELKNCTSKGELEIVIIIQLLSQYIRLEDSVLNGILALSKDAEESINQQTIHEATVKFNKLGADFQDSWDQEYWKIYNQLREGSLKERRMNFQDNIDLVVDMAISLNRIDRKGKKSVQLSHVLMDLDNISKKYRESTLSQTGSPQIAQTTPKSHVRTNQRCLCGLF